MQWTEDGRIQITRKFALGLAATIIALALVAMFLIGMIIGGNDNGNTVASIDPTPSVMAAEQNTQTPTITAAEQETQTPRITAAEQETQTPRVMAAEQKTETPTATLKTVDQQIATVAPTKPQAGTKTEYSTCLVRTQRTLALDAEDARFTPWPDYGSNQSVWDIIRYRHIDYISDHCRDTAPPPPTTYSGTCIPRELQSFYRRHIPEGSDNDNFRAIAAEYALTVCQPSAER